MSPASFPIVEYLILLGTDRCESFWQGNIHSSPASRNSTVNLDSGPASWKLQRQSPTKKISPPLPCPLQFSRRPQFHLHLHLQLQLQLSTVSITAAFPHPARFYFPHVQFFLDIPPDLLHATSTYRHRRLMRGLHVARLLISLPRATSK